MQIVRYRSPSGNIQPGIMTGNQISGHFTMALSFSVLGSYSNMHTI
jgi:hypothetical protein